MSNDDISKSRRRFLKRDLVTLPPLAAKSVDDLTQMTLTPGNNAP